MNTDTNNNGDDNGGATQLEKDKDQQAIESAAGLVSIESDTHNQRGAPVEDDYYYERPVANLAEKKDKDEDGKCTVNVSECSGPTEDMSDNAAVACSGVHLDGTVPIEGEEKCRLITEYGKTVE